MKGKRFLGTTAAMVLVLVLLMGLAPRSTASLAVADAPAGNQAGARAPYAGHLTDPEGRPVADGAYVFTLALYDAAEGGSPLWTETQAGVPVRGGSFSVLLGSANPLPSAALQGTHYLEVAVRGPGEAAATTLAPRQLWAAAAGTSTAPVACAHTHFGETWQGSAGLKSALSLQNSKGVALSATGSTGNEDWSSLRDWTSLVPIPARAHRRASSIAE